MDECNTNTTTCVWSGRTYVIHFLAAHDSKLDDGMTAVFGLALFSSLTLVSAACIWATVGVLLREHRRRQLRLAFFVCMCISSLLDLPRYVFLAATIDYEDNLSKWLRICYSCHIAASCVFFCSFSLVVRIWSRVFEQFAFRLLRPRELGVANALFSGLALATILELNLNPEHGSVRCFFSSWLFTIYSYTDALKSIIYSALIMRCLGKARQYRRATTKLEGTETVSAKLRVLMLVMGVCVACFLDRFVIIILKQLVLHDWLLNECSLSLFTFAWNFFADFVPRGGPSIALLVSVWAQSRASGRRRSVEDAAGCRCLMVPSHDSSGKQTPDSDSPSTMPSGKLVCSAKEAPGAAAGLQSANPGAGGRLPPGLAPTRVHEPSASIRLSERSTDEVVLTSAL